MKIYINDLALNDGSNGLYLDDPIDGLGLPDVRTSTDVYSGRDGGYAGNQFYGTRPVSIPGRVWSADPTQLWDIRALLLDALDTDAIELRVEPDDNHHYLLHAVLAKQPDFPVQRSLNESPFKIDLLCPDPIIYDNTSGGELTANIPKTVGGGVSWPLTWPLNWAAGAGSTTVSNSGKVIIQPVVTITGSATNPIISNDTTGDFVQLNLTTPAGSVIVIDLRNRTVTLNGGNILANVVDGSNWWGLLPGDNSIRLVTSDSNDTATAVVTWRNGVMGI